MTEAPREPLGYDGQAQQAEHRESDQEHASASQAVGYRPEVSSRPPNVNE